MNSDILKEVCKAVYKLANNKLSNGEVPLMLGVEGQLALMWEAIRRWNHEKSDDKIMNLAVAAIFAVFTQSKTQFTKRLDMAIHDEVVADAKLDNEWKEVGSATSKKKISPMALDDGGVISDPDAWKIDPDHEEELGESTKD